MSASDHISPKLFMLAKDIMNLSTSDSRMNLPMSENRGMTQKKLRESMYGPEHGTHGEYAEEGDTTLFNSIKEHGIISPVHIKQQDDGNHSLIQGHHRVAVANFLNPLTPVPIKFVTGPEKESWED